MDFPDLEHQRLDQRPWVACVIQAAIVMHEAELRPYIEACQLGERRAALHFRAVLSRCLGCAFAHVRQGQCAERRAEGFLKVFNNSRYTPKVLSSWMRTSQVNTAIDAIRRRNATGWVLGDEASFSL